MTEKPKRKSKASSDLLRGCHPWTHLYGWWLLLPLIGCGVVMVVTAVGTVLYFAIATVLPPHTVASCEIFFTDTTGFRTRILAQGFNGETLTYEVTRDSNETWLTLYQSSSSRYSTKPSRDCGAFAIESDIFFWIIPQGGGHRHFIVTHDGGMTWHEWHVSDVEEYPVGFHCNSIEEVSFQDMTYGGMQVGCSRYDGDTFLRRQNINLFTGDGGITWALTYE